MANNKPQISAADKFRTLELYLQHQNTQRVGDRLGLHPAAVRCRLLAIGIKLRPRGTSSISVEDVNGAEHIAQIKEELRTQIADEAAQSIQLVFPGSITAAQTYETLELYLRLQNVNRVGELLGINGNAVRGRLRRLGIKLRPNGGSHNVTVEDVNDPEHIATIKRQLRAQIAAEAANPAT